MIDEIERQAEALAQSNAEVRAFAKAVLHGDDEHKAWLIEAAEAFVMGKPLPPPREKGTTQSNVEPPKDLYSGVFRGPDWLDGVFYPPPRPDAKPTADEIADAIRKTPEFQQSMAALSNVLCNLDRPDASAGLTEAAEWHETADKQLRKEAGILYTESRFEEARTFEIQATIHGNSAKHFRARAADRRK